MEINKSNIFRSLLILLFGLFVGYFGSGLVIGEKKADLRNRYWPDRWGHWDILFYADSAKYNAIVDTIRKRMPNHPDYLFYSLYLANNRGYVPANYNVYKGIMDLYDLNGIELDKRSRDLALTYLERGAKLGHEKAIKELERIRKCDKRFRP